MTVRMEQVIADLIATINDRSAEQSKKLDALNSISDISKIENHLNLLMNDLLISAMINLLFNGSLIECNLACNIISNLAYITDNKARLMSNSKLLEGLIFQLNSLTEQRLTVCETLINLVNISESAIIVGNYDLGLISALNVVIKTETGMTQITALKVLQCLTNVPENESLVIKADLGLIPTLVTVIEFDKAVARHLSCAILRNLTVSPLNVKHVLKYGLNVLHILLIVAEDFETDTQPIACWILCNISFFFENKVSMVSNKSLGLLPLMIKIMAYKESRESRLAACSVVMNLACVDENHEVLITPELGLLPILVTVLMF